MATSSISLCIAAVALLFSAVSSAAEAPGASVVIHAEPLHRGTVNPMLFGNFVEMLDDVVPGMWAEMLNDRSFEGVAPMRNGIYYDGSPDICDREWDRNGTWDFDADQPGFLVPAKGTPDARGLASERPATSGQAKAGSVPTRAGAERPVGARRCVRLMATRGSAGSLTQSGLAVKSGMSYAFSGYFRTDNPTLRVTVSLETPSPDGKWTTLASAELTDFSPQWRKVSASMISSRQSAQAVFRIKAEGEGRLWADKVSLMPADNENGWRRDVVDAVKELNPPIIRWGGSVIDPGNYLWKNGIGDRDLRASFPNKPWGRIDSNDVGIDEFCQLCELVGAEPLICVSFADGPESAAEMARYCNDDAKTEWGGKRAASGHLAPYHVKYWQIGNEVRGDDAEYLARIEDFVRLMKQADPNAALMSSYPAQKLLDLTGNALSFVCPHLYTRDIAACDQRLTDVSRMIDKTPGCENVKIGVTEWNISAEDWGLLRGKQMTLESALLNARMLNVFLRHCDKVEIATRSNMANSFCGATFETNPAGVLRRPAHYVMEMYRRRARPIPLRVDAAENGLDTFACASADGKSVTIFAVNSRENPEDLSLRFEGFETPVHIVSAEAVRDTRDARQLDVMNHWDAPGRVKTIALVTAKDKVALPAFSVCAIECESK